MLPSSTSYNSKSCSSKDLVRVLVTQEQVGGLDVPCLEDEGMSHSGIVFARVCVCDCLVQGLGSLTKGQA